MSLKVGNSTTLIFTTNVQKTKEFASKASIANMYYSLLSLASFLTINLVQFQPHLTISGLIGKSEHIVSILPKKWEQFYLLCTQSWHLHKITFLWNTQVNENEQCEHDYYGIFYKFSLYSMDYVRDGKIQGQCAFKKTKERPCISPSLT